MHRVELIWGNKARMGYGQHMKEHRHSCFQLYYILKGNPTYLISGTELTATVGSYFIVPEAATHSMYPIKDNQMVCYELKFLIHDPQLSSHFQSAHAPKQDSGVVRTLLKYIIKNWSTSDESVVADIECILVSILMSFYVDSVYLEKRDSRFVLTSQYSPITKEILIYLERNYSRNFTLGYLSEALSYSKNYLSSSFKADTGYSIIDYLNMLRVHHAIVTFVYYDQDIASACECVGYTDCSYFSRVFKNYTGVPPRAFKKALANPALSEDQKHDYLEPVINFKRNTMDDTFSALRKIQKFANIYAGYSVSSTD